MAGQPNYESQQSGLHSLVGLVVRGGGLAEHRAARGPELQLPAARAASPGLRSAERLWSSMAAPPASTAVPRASPSPPATGDRLDRPGGKSETAREDR